MEVGLHSRGRQELNEYFNEATVSQTNGRQHELEETEYQK
jgi:hypothetical protein